MTGKTKNTQYGIALVVIIVAATFIFAFSDLTFAKDPQLPPTRLSSIGGSVTLGSNAEHMGKNPNASWVNGYFGFWEWMQGLTDVSSHSQRITEVWGSSSRANYSNAIGGAGMATFRLQSQRAVQQKASYVTVFLGNNDLCKRYTWQIPSDSEFETNFRAGLERLRTGLPAGATIYVVSLLDLTRLNEVAGNQTGMNSIDCTVIWSHPRFPCQTVLGPQNTEVDRAYIRSRNIGYNGILERVTVEYQEQDAHHYYYYSDAPFTYPFTVEDVSSIDCFHPSAAGQRALATVTWNTGPFAGF